MIGINSYNTQFMYYLKPLNPKSLYNILCLLTFLLLLLFYFRMFITDDQEFPMEPRESAETIKSTYEAPEVFKK